MSHGEEKGKQAYMLDMKLLVCGFKWNPGPIPGLRLVMKRPWDLWSQSRKPKGKAVLSPHSAAALMAGGFLSLWAGDGTPQGAGEKLMLVPGKRGEVSSPLP